MASHSLQAKIRTPQPGRQDPSSCEPHLPLQLHLSPLPKEHVTHLLQQTPSRHHILFMSSCPCLDCSLLWDECVPPPKFMCCEVLTSSTSELTLWRQGL